MYTTRVAAAGEAAAIRLSFHVRAGVVTSFAVSGSVTVTAAAAHNIVFDSLFCSVIVAVLLVNMGRMLQGS